MGLVCLMATCLLDAVWTQPTHPTHPEQPQEGTAALLAGAKDAAAYAAAWQAQHGSTSLAHRLAAAKAQLALVGPSAAVAELLTGGAPKPG